MMQCCVVCAALFTVIVRVMILVLSVFVCLGCDLLRDDVCFFVAMCACCECVCFVCVRFVCGVLCDVAWCVPFCCVCEVVACVCFMFV